MAVAVPSMTPSASSTRTGVPRVVQRVAEVAACWRAWPAVVARSATRGSSAIEQGVEERIRVHRPTRQLLRSDTARPAEFGGELVLVVLPGQLTVDRRCPPRSVPRPTAGAAGRRREVGLGQHPGHLAARPRPPGRSAT